MKIKALVVAAAAATMLVVGSGSGAKAVVYSFNNVALSDGGLLNGTLDIQFGGVFGYALTTTGGSLPSLDRSYNYPGFPSPNANPFGNPTVVQIFPDGNTITIINFISLLQLTFSGDLMVAGPHTLLGGNPGPSFECSGTFLCAVGDPTGATVRYIATNTTIDVAGAAPPNAVPLPAALPLLAGGLGALGLMGWRRKRKAQSAA